MKSTSRILNALLAISLAFLPAMAHANILDDIGDAIGGEADTAVQVVTAPAKTVINAAGAAIGQNKPSAIFQPYKDLGKAAGDTLAAGTNVVTAPEEFLYQKALEAAK